MRRQKIRCVHCMGALLVALQICRCTLKCVLNIVWIENAHRSSNPLKTVMLVIKQFYGKNL